METKEAVAKRKPFHARIKLHVLLRITQAINNNIPAEELFGIFEFVLAQQLSIQKFAFCSSGDTGWKWAASKGIEKKTLAQIKPEKMLVPFTEIADIGNSILGDISGFEVIIPVFHKKKPLAYILLAKSNKRISKHTKMRHVEFVQTISNIIAVAIENKRLAKEAVQQEVFQKELQMASVVQNMLMPANLPINKHLHMSARYHPQKEIGGDYFDYIKLSDEEGVFCMADVSGKGISAALIMANFQGYLHSVLALNLTLTETIILLNERVIESAKGERFITIFLAKFNYENKQLTYVNAGHNPPVMLKNNVTSTLSDGCVGLGMLDEIPSINVGSETIEAGTIITCYTDGMVEQENDKGKEFGIEKMAEIIQSHQRLQPEEINTLLFKSIENFKGKKAFSDDIALLTCKFK
jgi:sigma-B regulation protein RsbU (phosphoserine phosphatase)